MGHQREYLIRRMVDKYKHERNDRRMHSVHVSIITAFLTIMSSHPIYLLLAPKLILHLVLTLELRPTPPTAYRTPPLEISKKHLKSPLHPKWLILWSASCQEAGPLFLGCWSQSLGGQQVLSALLSKYTQHPPTVQRLYCCPVTQASLPDPRAT